MSTCNIRFWEEKYFPDTPSYLELCINYHILFFYQTSSIPQHADKQNDCDDYISDFFFFFLDQT